MVPSILRFTPIYKEKIWGGRKLDSILKRNIPEGDIGETWEISDYLDDKSVVVDTPWKGRDFRSLYKMYPREILGDGMQGIPFPLLIKIIDAKEKLSVQVHPNDDYAKKNDPKNSGKKEAWIVIQADPDAQLVVGFEQNTTKEKYKTLIEKNQAESILKYHPVKKGDAFLLEPGTVHAIGAGVLLLEIQQSSDSTYRVYDYGRPRELHLEKALDVLNYKAFKGKEKLSYKESFFAGAGELCELTENDKFRIYSLVLDDLSEFEPEDFILPVVTKKTRFHIYSMLSGEIKLQNGMVFKQGDTFMVTAKGTQEEQLFQVTGSAKVQMIISTVGSDFD
ncbi:MAG: mannose-6-phosphate isomerase [Leptospira sp.]|jgi:mannose-6-phosphate isomerase|nr:mannose-6-phosphate isomerase [Leptospira sp.]NCS94125.1 mannose-6-phosphate isomerase [Leptospira sp.]